MNRLLLALSVLCACGSAESEAPLAVGPPDTMLVAAPPDFSNQPHPVFSFAATGAVESFLCALDGAELAACATPFELDVAEGEHTLTVVAVGPGGEDSSPVSFRWRVDLTPPDTTIAEGPRALTNLPDAPFSIAASEPAVISCSLDGGAFGPCAASYPGLTEGEHVLRAQAVDLAGNLDASAVEWRWVVDLTPPVASIVSGPGSPTNDVFVDFTLAANEEGARWEYIVDGQEAKMVDSPELEMELGTPGEHVFQLWAHDLAGNRSQAPVRYFWTLDTALPDTDVLEEMPAYSKEIAVTLTPVSSKEGSSFFCRLDGIGPRPEFLPCESPVRVSHLAAGPHTFEVYAVDQAGNADPSPARVTWTVDLTAPRVEVVCPRTDAPSERATFTATDTNLSGTTCTIDGVTVGCGLGTISFRDALPGRHSLRVDAVDKAGWTGTAPCSWDVVTGRGHAVLIGHDYYGADSAGLSEILRRSVQIERSTETLEIGMVVGTADNAETARILAIVAGISGQKLLATTAQDGPDAIVAMMQRSRVLLVLDQNGDAASMAKLATPTLLDATRDFYAHGGVVVVLDGGIGDGGGGLSGTWAFMRDTRLVPVSGVNPPRAGIRVEIAAQAPADPIIAPLFAPFDAVAWTVGYVVDDRAMVVFARVDPRASVRVENPLVIHSCDARAEAGANPRPCGYPLPGG